jgi:hypothetical protein
MPSSAFCSIVGSARTLSPDSHRSAGLNGRIEAFDVRIPHYSSGASIASIRDSTLTIPEAKHVWFKHACALVIMIQLIAEE